MLKKVNDIFRQKLEEVITLPPPPVEDLEEAYEVEKIIQV